MDLILPPPERAVISFVRDGPIEDGLEVMEDAEDYDVGGFHIIAIGDYYSQGRYKVLHKLGYGGSSTVWLARDKCAAGALVALKAMRADASSAPPNEISSLAIPKVLRARLPPSVNILTVKDHFFVRGPNGSHLFLVSPLAGPNVASMARAARSQRLRADLARKVAKQTAMAVYHMHRAGVVHGDITTHNILFSLSPHVLRWSDRMLYANFGKPTGPSVKYTTRNPMADAALVAPIASSRLTDAHFLRENVILADFGQSYAVASLPRNYKPATIPHNTSPEAYFEGRAGLEADVWGLACTIFEIRAGFPLLELFFGDDLEFLIEMVSMLGHLPDPWWSAFAQRAEWFEENGEPKRMEDQVGLLRAEKTCILETLGWIGVEDDASNGKPVGPMFEIPGARMEEEEVALLGDLLEKMLRYCPEERIKMDEVIAHPWFSFRVRR